VRIVYCIVNECAVEADHGGWRLGGVECRMGSQSPPYQGLESSLEECVVMHWKVVFY
jgi:hypothetical protein